MKGITPTLVLWLLFAQCGAVGTSPVKAKEHLNGSWIVAAVSWGGEERPLTQKEKGRMIWTFSGKHFKYDDDSTKDEKIAEAGTYRIDQGKSPRHLDLTYTKGDVLGTHKCIYALKADELKIAFTLSFAPGTPEDEIEEAKRTFAIRPKRFESQPDDLTFIFVLKRQKK